MAPVPLATENRRGEHARVYHGAAANYAPQGALERNEWQM